MRNEIETLASAIESLLFVSDVPLTAAKLKEILEIDDAEAFKAAIQLLQESYAAPLRGIQLQEVAGGYQLRTHHDNANYILRFQQGKPQRLSRAALETLAIIAYKQPITRPEIESIRGVDSGAVLKNILEKDLVRILGKKEEPGNPLVYGTTDNFLIFFGIKSLRELPSLKEYSELKQSNETLSLDNYAQALEAQVAHVDESNQAVEEVAAPAAETEALGDAEAASLVTQP